MTVYSLELYPDTKKDDAALVAVVEGVTARQLDFVSVTCTRDDFALTLRLCQALKAAGIVPAAHLLCGNRSEKQLRAHLDEMAAAGISRVVALRGDQGQAGAGEERRLSTEGLVALLAAHGSFDEICVAGYPDIHPQAQSLSADIAYLKRKLDAGATRVITQFTFDTNALLDFRNALVATGIAAPISVGLLPIQNFARMLAFAARCGAKVTAEVKAKFEAADASLHRDLAQGVLDDMTAALLEAGFDLHFYSLNSPRMINLALEASAARRRQRA